MLCPGAGGWQAISRPKNEIQYHIVSCSNGGVLTVGSPRDDDREQADVANHTIASARPLQMSLVDPRPNSPWRRPHRWVQLDRSGGNTPGTFSTSCTNWKKKSKPLPSIPAMGRMVLTVLGMVAEMELGFIRDRQRAGIDAARQRVFARADQSLSTARASCRCGFGNLSRAHPFLASGARGESV
jgi:hypothetical protein